MELAVLHEKILPTLTFAKVTYTILFPDLLRDLTDEEYQGLAKSVKDQGKVIVPVVLDGNWGVIDGANRLRIAIYLGLREIPFIVRPGLTHEQKRLLALELNLHRRHLTPEQRREYVALELKKDPTRSNRSLAEQANTNHHVVQDVRQDLEAQGVIPETPARIGSDGKYTHTVHPSPCYVGENPTCQADGRTLDTPKTARPHDFRRLAPTSVTDHFGRPVPDAVRAAFNNRSEFNRIINTLGALKSETQKLASSPGGQRISFNHLQDTFQGIQAAVRFGEPYVVCPTCHTENSAECRLCQGLGWLIKTVYDNMSTDLQNSCKQWQKGDACEV